LKLAGSDYVYFIDDDNVFGADFFARTIAEYLTLKQDYKQDIILSPMIMWRDTERVQSL
jgi:cell division protein YceG involved in septum cleavage